MDDLISRQAAIDAVAKGLKHVFVENQDIAEKMIGSLPSAKPDVPDMNVGDMISRQAALKGLEDLKIALSGNAICQSMIAMIVHGSWSM